jgi:hypothetical protein
MRPQRIMVSLESDSCENKNLREDTSLTKSSRVRFLTQEIQAHQHSVSLAGGTTLGPGGLESHRDSAVDIVPVFLIRSDT